MWICLSLLLFFPRVKCIAQKRALQRDTIITKANEKRRKILLLFFSNFFPPYKHYSLGSQIGKSKKGAYDEKKYLLPSLLCLLHTSLVIHHLTTHQPTTSSKKPHNKHHRHHAVLTERRTDHDPRRGRLGAFCFFRFFRFPSFPISSPP